MNIAEIIQEEDWNNDPCYNQYLVNIIDTLCRDFDWGTDPNQFVAWFKFPSVHIDLGEERPSFRELVEQFDIPEESFPKQFASFGEAYCQWVKRNCPYTVIIVPIR